jgi:hypothetical protein
MALIKRKKLVSVIKKEPNSQPETPEINVESIYDAEMVPEENWDESDIIAGEPITIDNERALPKPKGKNLTFDELMAYLKQFTSEHWKHTMVYCYRTFPRINKKLDDPTANTSIDKISEPITKEEFVARHGGGKYKIIVNDLDVGYRKSNRSICYSMFAIDWVNFPPVLNLRELMVDEEVNKAYINYLISKGQLDPRTKEVMNPNTNTASMSDMASVLMKMLDQNQANIRNIIDVNRNSGNSSEAIQLQKIISEERSKREDLLIKMMEDKGAGGMDMLVKMLELIRPSETGGNGQIALMQQMMQMQKDHSEMMMKVLLASKEETKPTKSFAEQLQEFKEVGELMGLGQGGGGRKTIAGELIEAAREILPNVVNAVGSYFAFKAGGALPNMPTSTVPNTPVTQMPQQISQAPLPQATAVDLKQQAGMFLQTYGNILINQLDNNYDGHEAAEMVIGMVGMDTYAQILALGEDNLIEAGKSNAAFWQRASVVVKGEENLIRWIKDFFEGPGSPEDDESEINEDTK